MMLPEPFFGIMIAVGLTETLTFISGFTLGVVPGFVTGCSIITISDIATLPGAWTPFIALIIGLIGVIAGVMRSVITTPTVGMMALSAMLLTLMSETLQNVWVALFYNVPVAVTMVIGLSTLIAALANNIILFTTVGLKIIPIISDSSVRRT